MPEGGNTMKSARLITALLFALGCAPAFAQVTPMPGDPLTGSGVVSRTVNTYATLTGTAQPTAIVSDTNGFGIPATAAAPTNTFEGTLTLASVTTIGNYTSVYDPLAYSSVTAWKHLGANSGTSLVLQFVQNGSWLIPVTQGLQYTGSSNWNIIIGYGRVWNETSDNGYTRASFPFTLAEYNQNCVHNGEMTFLFNGSSISHVFYQIDYEVCAYWQANFYGNLTATYTPSTISGDTTMENNASAEIANRIPTKPFSSLATDYPGSGVSTAGFIGQYLHPTYIAGYGLYINGINYVSTCQTRTDAYAFCSEMRWPSYSVAKSAFAETALSRLGQQFGSGVYSLLMKNYIPQYTIGGSWTNTTFDNLADMASGNYNSTGFETDENSTSETNFVGAVPYYNYTTPTAASKIYDAFNLFKTNTTTPGTTWVYHSHDTFLQTSAMEAYAQTQLGASTDIWTKTYTDVFSPLNVSQGMQQIMRTACNNQSTSSNCSSATKVSATGAPIGSHGMYFIADDLAKIGYFFNNNNGKINGTQVLDPAREDDSMVRTSNIGLVTADSGFYTGSPIVANTNHYNNDYWTKYWTTTEFPPNSGATENGGLATNPFNSTFTCQFWIPYMSGYGGNTVLLLPNNSVFYLFSEDYEYYWTYAVEQANLIKPMCGTGINYPANGSALKSNSQTFQWYMYNTATMSATAPTAPAPATAYWLDIGKEQGGNEYYQSGSLGTALSVTVNTLPTDGSTIWVRWWYYANGQWQYTDYHYTAYNGVPNGDTLATMTSPVAPGPLSGSSVTFNWAAGTGATAYWLDIGSSAGGSQYYQSGSLSSTTLQATANALPTDGSTVYATLYTKFSSSGQWVSNSYTYTAYNLAAAGGVITTPVPASTLTASSVTFNWTAGAGASAYWLDVGSTPGGNQFYQSGNLGNVLATTVNGLPTDGSAIYVTLYSLIGAQWSGNAYTYTAFNATSGLAVIQTPVPSTTLSGSSAIFTWSSDANASAYWLDIGNTPGGNQYYQSGNLGNALTTPVYSLPADGSTIYVTLYSFVGGQWLSNAYTYVSGP